MPIMHTNGVSSDERIMRRANGEFFWCRITGHELVPEDTHAASIWAFKDLSEKRKVSAGLSSCHLIKEFSASTSSELVHRLLGVT